MAATLGHTLAAMGRDRPVVLRYKDVSAALRNSAVFSTAF